MGFLVHSQGRFPKHENRHKGEFAKIVCEKRLSGHFFRVHVWALSIWVICALDLFRIWDFEKQMLRAMPLASLRRTNYHPMGAGPGEVAAGDTDIAGELWRTAFLDDTPVEPVLALA